MTQIEIEITADEIQQLATEVKDYLGSEVNEDKLAEAIAFYLTDQIESAKEALFQSQKLKGYL